MYELIIEARRTEQRYWRDLWHYRELLWTLVWRDLLARYKQTAIGVSWAILRPLLTMAVFVLVFHRLAKLDGHGVPYPVLVFAAMVPWQFFSSALSEAGNSLVGSANLISKIYFPRLLVPLATIATSVVDTAFSVVVMAAMMAWYHAWPGWRVVTLPLFFLVAAALAIGCGLWLSALTVRYRDFRIVIPFIVQFGLFLSPVGYTSDRVPEAYRLLYSLNPMVGVIDGFRWALLGGASQIFWPGFAASLGLVAFVLLTGVWYFRRTERTLADVI